MDVSTFIILGVITSTVSIVSNLLLHLRIRSSCQDGCQVEPVRTESQRNIPNTSNHSSDDTNSTGGDGAVIVNELTQSQGDNIEMKPIQFTHFPTNHDKPPHSTPRTTPRGARRSSSDNDTPLPLSRRNSVSSVISDVISGVVDDLAHVGVEVIEQVSKI